MDASQNPYSPGAGLPPPELAGRGDDITAFETLLALAAAGRTSQSMVLTGLRGVGKTVLLNDLAARARRAGWVVAQIEGRADNDASGAFRHKVSRELNRSLRELSGRWSFGDKVESALATFKSFALTTDPGGGLSLGIEVDPQRGRADTGSLEMDLSDLAFDLAGSAGDHGVGVVVLIDEMQDLDRDELAAICIACHEAGQRSVPFYVVGAGLPSLPGVLTEARSYAERLFAYLGIGPLDRDAAAVALTRPAESLGVRWTEEALEYVIDASAGYPYFVQEFAKATWGFAPGPGIDASDADVGVRAGRAKLDGGFFRSRWNRATPSERAYLKAMARDGDGPAHSSEIARRLGKGRVQQVGPIRANLIHKGLVYAPEHGQVSYTVPGMADFVTRQID